MRRQIPSYVNKPGFFQPKRLLKVFKNKVRGLIEVTRQVKSQLKSLQVQVCFKPQKRLHLAEPLFVFPIQKLFCQ